MSVPEWAKALAIAAGTAAGLTVVKKLSAGPLQPLIVDAYAQDPMGDLAPICADSRVGGIILKATEGLNYAPAWFPNTFPTVRAAFGDRYAVTGFRGCYHFLHVLDDGAAQADAFQRAIDGAGGLDAGTFAPIVDFELEESSGGNASASAQQITDCVSAFAARCNANTGRPVILYSGSALGDKGITDRMGCWKLWYASYTATLPESVYTSAGWSLDDLFAWQYQGTGAGNEGRVTGYPSGALWDGSDQLDLSAAQMDLSAACAPLSLFV